MKNYRYSFKTYWRRQ